MILARIRGTVLIDTYILYNQVYIFCSFFFPLLVVLVVGVVVT